MSDSAFLNYFIFVFIGAQFTIFGYLSYYAGKNKRFDLRAFGIKTHSTLSNPEVWAVISKDAGLAIMWEGIATLIASIVFRDVLIRYYIEFTFVSVAVVTVTVIKYAISASKMARQLSEGTEIMRAGEHQ